MARERLSNLIKNLLVKSYWSHEVYGWSQNRFLFFGLGTEKKKQSYMDLEKLSSKVFILFTITNLYNSGALEAVFLELLTLEWKFWEGNYAIFYTKHINFVKNLGALISNSKKHFFQPSLYPGM